MVPEMMIVTGKKIMMDMSLLSNQEAHETKKMYRPTFVSYLVGSSWSPSLHLFFTLCNCMAQMN